MARQVLNLGSLIMLDGGRAEKAFNLELQKIVADLDDRPAVTKARKVTLELNIEPTNEEHGAVVDAEVTFRVGSKIPGRQTKAYRMKIDGAKGTLVFNPDAPENADQTTIGDHLKTNAKAK